MERSSIHQRKHVFVPRANPFGTLKNAFNAIFLITSIILRRNVNHAPLTSSIIPTDRTVRGVQVINLSSMGRHVVLVHPRNTSISPLKNARNAPEDKTMIARRKLVSALRVSPSTMGLTVLNAIFPNTLIDI